MMATSGNAELTPGAIKAIFSGQNPSNPIVQILGHKLMKTEGKPDRYRLLISDGTHKQPSAMLTTQLNKMITTEKTIKKNSIVQLEKYVCNVVSGRTIVIILGCKVLQTDVGSVIGTPEVHKEDSSASSTAASAAPAASKPSAGNPYNRSPEKKKNAPPKGGAQPFGKRSQPIASLNPYGSGRWTICARITNKPPIRQWSNARGEGKLFSVDMLDDSGEIRGTGFNEAVTRLYDSLEVGQVYYIRGGRLKPANKKFSNLNNEYEINFDDSTTVEPAADTGVVPQQKYDFVKFKDLENREPNSFVDVIAVVADVGTLTSITIKRTGRDAPKRDIQLKDADAYIVQCTLWGKDAESFELNGGEVGSVMAVKAAKLSDFNGRSLSVSGSSTMTLNPDIPESHELRAWFDNGGMNEEGHRLTTSVSREGDKRILISTIKTENLGQRDDGKADYFVTRATVSTMKKEGCCYTACPTCNKKVIEEGDGRYRCEKCDKTLDSFQWRLFLQIRWTDFSGEMWAPCFQDAAELILNQKSADIGEWSSTDDERFTEAINKAMLQPFLIKCRAGTETWNEEARVKKVVVDCQPINYKEESKYLVTNNAFKFIVEKQLLTKINAIKKYL